MSSGTGRGTTIVFYGDNFNWWAAYALWVCTLFGHRDVRLLDGGRQKWAEEGRPMTTEVPQRLAANYPVVERTTPPSAPSASRSWPTSATAAGWSTCARPASTKELLAMPDYPQEGALRGGHIPGAANVPWKRAANDGTFKTAEELRAIYQGELGLGANDDIVAYCRIGERSSYTWFVLSQLLGFRHVRNYDGSWVEWGNSVRVPIERSSEPGPDPRLKAVG